MLTLLPRRTEAAALQFHCAQLLLPAPGPLEAQPAPQPWTQLARRHVPVPRMLPAFTTGRLGSPPLALTVNQV